MFPTSSLITLLSFARGKTPWGKPVFDAAIEVAVYFGQAFFPADIIGSINSEISDYEAAEAIDDLVTSQSLQDGPATSVSPAIIVVILKYVLQLMLKRIS